ncbi:MAG: AAA family ATPase [Planctomycetes bacterium]|nr:AAA family ATPase [Planctomycetota bacterium]
MINSLSVHGFRSLYGLEVPELGRFNIVVGPGNSGKTNFLEAVFLSCSSGDPQLLHKALNFRRILADILTPKEIVGHLDLCWSIGLKEASFTIGCKWDGQLRQNRYERSLSKGDIPLVTKNESSPGAKSEIVQLGDEEAELRNAIAVYGVETSTQEEPSLSGKMIVTDTKIAFKKAGVPNLPAFYVAPFPSGLSHSLAPKWSDVEDRSEGEPITELMKTLDAGIQGIRIASDELGHASVQVHHKELGRLPLEVMGSGFGKALAIACHLVSARNGVLVIDEIDASLHIGAQSTLIGFILQAAARHNVQLFMATHSLETLDTFLEKFEDVSELWGGPQDLRVIQLSRVKNQTSAKVVDADMARELRDDLGLDLRRAV